MAYGVLTHTSTGNAGGGSTTSAIDTTGASLLVFVISKDNVSDPTPSDSKGNTWLAGATSGGGNFQNQLYYAENPVVGSGHTFTTNLTGTIAVCAFSGAKTSSVADNNSGASGPSPGAITPSENNCLVVSGFSGWTDSTAVDSGMTLIESFSLGGGGHYSCALAYKMQTTAAEIDPAWSDFAEEPSPVYRSTIQAFKAAGSSSLPPVLKTYQAVHRASNF